MIKSQTRRHIYIFFNKYSFSVLTLSNKQTNEQKKNEKKEVTLLLFLFCFVLNMYVVYTCDLVWNVIIIIMWYNVHTLHLLNTKNVMSMKTYHLFTNNHIKNNNSTIKYKISMISFKLIKINVLSTCRQNHLNTHIFFVIIIV